MTLPQLHKVVQLHKEGWMSIPDPKGDCCCGGPCYLKSPTGEVHVVNNDGTHEPYAGQEHDG